MRTTEADRPIHLTGSLAACGQHEAVGRPAAGGGRAGGPLLAGGSGGRLCNSIWPHHTRHLFFNKMKHIARIYINIGIFICAKSITSNQTMNLHGRPWRQWRPIGCRPAAGRPAAGGRHAVAAEG